MKAIIVVFVIFCVLLIAHLFSEIKESIFNICFRHGTTILFAWATIFYICKTFNDCVPAGNIYNEYAVLFSVGAVIIIVLGGLISSSIGVLMCISEIEELKESKNKNSQRGANNEQ